MNYKGVIIEESLGDAGVLKKVKILDTKVEAVTENHRTPWTKQWTLHTVEVAASEVEKIAEEISSGLDKEHSWYADFKNDKFHFIIYSGKIFKVDLRHPVLYNDAREYGISIGIPEYQVDFAPDDKIWEREIKNPSSPLRSDF